MKPGPPLALDPRACDRCGSCLGACPHDALKVGRTYLSVDWQRCDACGACARVCARRAITLRDAGSSRRSSAPVGGGHPKPSARHTTGTPRSRSAAAGTPRGRGGDTAAPPSSAGASGRGAAADRALLEKIRSLAPAAANRSERPAPKAGKRGGFQWTLLEAAAMLSVTFAAFMLKETVPLLPALSTLPADLVVPMRVGLLALYYVAQVSVLVWLVHRRGGEASSALGLRGAGRSFGFHLTSAGLVLSGLVVTRLIASLYAYITRELGLLPTSATDLPTLFGSDATGFILAVAMVVVIGPVVEEAVFRGALLEGLAARMGVWPAIVVQALLFAVFHRSLWMLVPTFVLGVVLGWVAHTRESLWPPILIHGLYNAVTVAAAFLVSSPG